MIYEHIKCNLCNSSEYKVKYRKPDNFTWKNQFEFPVVECVNCGLIYVNPRPTKTSMSMYYPEGYHDNRGVDNEKTRYDKQYNFISDYQAEKILDIGCARGDFLAYYKSNNPNVSLYGCDLYSDKVNFDFIEFKKGELTECEYPDNYFDLVTSWAAFEHIFNPLEYFSESSRILNAKGKLVILVTNSKSCYGKFAYSEDIPRHTYHYSIDTLSQFAIKSHMELENIIFTDSIFDGRGFGTFRYLLSRLVRYDFRRRYFGQANMIQQSFEFFGKLLDYLVFTLPWERKFKVSGIMVAVFRKAGNTT